MNTMTTYIGTKLIEAEPAIRVTGEDFSKKIQSVDWPIPGNAKVEEGYRVRYPDGYESWSPKDVFEEAYRPTDSMNFGLAIEAAKKGKKIARRNWNGKNQYVFLARDVEFVTDADVSEFEDKDVTVHDLLVIKTSQDIFQPGWLATQSDMLADDWCIVG